MNEQKRKMYLLVAALTAVCVLIILGGRILAGKRFELQGFQTFFYA